MLARLFLVVPLGIMTAAAAAWGDDGKVYTGTFKDAAGHAGSLRCELTAKDGGVWAANLSGNNTGSGPNKPYQYSGTLTGKADGAKLDLAGEITVQRIGPYVVTAVLTNDTMKASFKKKTGGGGDGSFDLTLAKGEAAPPPAAPVAASAAPAPKAEEQKPK
jgi:hypothetical protein